MQTASPTTRPEPSQTTGEILWDVVDLTSGAVVMLLPLFLLAVPGIAVFVVLPALVLLAAAAPVIVAGAVAVPTYLLARALRRHHAVLARPHEEGGTLRQARRESARGAGYGRPSEAGEREMEVVTALVEPAGGEQLRPLTFVSAPAPAHRDRDLGSCRAPALRLGSA